MIYDIIKTIESSTPTSLIALIMHISKYINGEIALTMYVF